MNREDTLGWCCTAGTNVYDPWEHLFYDTVGVLSGAQVRRVEQSEAFPFCPNCK